MVLLQLFRFWFLDEPVLCYLFWVITLGFLGFGSGVDCFLCSCLYLGIGGVCFAGFAGSWLVFGAIPLGVVYLVWF